MTPCVECGDPAVYTVERTAPDGKLLDPGPVALCAACAVSLNDRDGRFRHVDIVLGGAPLVDADQSNAARD